jgi:hypothetical protein
MGACPPSLGHIMKKLADISLAMFIGIFLAYAMVYGWAL